MLGGGCRAERSAVSDTQMTNATWARCARGGVGCPTRGVRHGRPDQSVQTGFL